MQKVNCDRLQLVKWGGVGIGDDRGFVNCRNRYHALLAYFEPYLKSESHISVEGYGVAETEFATVCM